MTESEILAIYNEKRLFLGDSLALHIQAGLNSFEEAIDILAEKVWEELVAIYNRQHSSRGQKPLERVYDEAARRGATAIQVESNAIEIFYRNVKFVYIFGKYGRFLYCEKLFTTIPCTMTSVKVKLDADKMFDCMEEMVDSMPTIRKVLQDKAMEARLEQTKRNITFPSIKIETDRRLEGTGIKYFVSNGVEDIMLYVNIVKELWYKGPVTLETLDHILTLVPYGINRPDRLCDLGPDFQTFNDYGNRVERAWKRYHDQNTAESSES